MHATVEQLLSLRDGEPVVLECRQHVETCDFCRAEIDRLRRRRADMCALPLLEPPPEVWSAVSARLDQPRRQPTLPKVVTAAVAATVVATIALTLQMRQPQPLPTPVTLETAAVTPAQEPAAAPESAPLDEVMARSARLESLLQALNSRAPRTIDAATADTIATLEDRIALLDYGMSRGGLPADRSEQAWRSRVDLMDALVHVRGAQIETGFHQIRSER